MRWHPTHKASYCRSQLPAQSNQALNIITSNIMVVVSSNGTSLRHTPQQVRQVSDDACRVGAVSMLIYGPYVNGLGPLGDLEQSLLTDNARAGYMSNEGALCRRPTRLKAAVAFRWHIRRGIFLRLLPV